MDKPICRWPECDRPTRALGLCNRDYQRARLTGDLESPWLTWPKKREVPATTDCRWPECDRYCAPGNRGFCRRDYERARKIGDWDSPWLAWESPARVSRKGQLCAWPECGRPAGTGGYCPRDYKRARLVGDMKAPWLQWNPLRPCSVCTSPFRGHRLDAKFCSRKCAVKSYAESHRPQAVAATQRWVERNRDKHRLHVHRRRARLMAAERDFVTIEQIWAKSGPSCYLCGQPIDQANVWPHPFAPSVDHIMPLARGGSHTVDNLAIVHLRCNVRKGTTIVHPT